MNTNRWTVEARIFNTGKVVAKMRPATEDDVEGRFDREGYMELIDIFDDERDARDFLRDYRRA